MNLKFIVPGLSKCGTTTLCFLLEQHPKIFLSNPKEPNFFSQENYREQWQSYKQLFTHSHEDQFCGEGSTFYSTAEHEKRTKQHILESFPDVKLIFIFRDPIDRIESAYREFHNSGPMFGLDCPYGLTSAIERFPVILEDSKYWTRLNNYLSDFPRENIKVLFLEDMRENTEVIVRESLEFIGISKQECANFTPTSIRLNAGSGKYFDTRLLRKMRNTPHLGQALSKLSIPQQEKYFNAMGLRRRFKNSIKWKQQDRDLVRKALQDDINRHLEFCNRPISIWPRFQSLVEG